MSNNEHYENQVAGLRKILWWSLLCIPSAFITGNVVSWLFWFIDWVTSLRISHPSFIYFLPVAGVAIYFIHKEHKDPSSNIVLQKIHVNGIGVNEKTAAPVFVTTLLTHLLGGSARREGSSIQIGASISDFTSGLMRLKGPPVKVVRTAGIAAGFGAAFGPPVTAAFFAFEVMREGSFPYSA